MLLLPVSRLTQDSDNKSSLPFALVIVRDWSHQSIVMAAGLAKEDRFTVASSDYEKLMNLPSSEDWLTKRKESTIQKKAYKLV